MDIILWGIFCIIAVCDLREHRIPNRLLILALVFKTFIFVLTDASLDMFFESIYSATMLFALGLLFYFLRGMSPGDVKLLGVIGYITGITEFQSLLFYLVMAGGVVAIFCLLDAISQGYKPKSLKQRTNELVLSKQLWSVPHSRYEQKLVMPFAPSVVIGLALFYYFN
ncbi:prepilin peptidase [Vibrio breoganii]